MTIHNRLMGFIEEERCRFEDRHNNMFAIAIAEVARYRRYLDKVSVREQVAAAALVSNTKAMQEKASGKSGPVSGELWNLHLQAVDLADSLHLEIESFYLFAKILLDKVARAIEFYFGAARGLALDSHDDFTKRLERYASIKGLNYEPALMEHLQQLKKEVSDFRDHRVSHEKSPRTLRGFAFSSLDGGDSRMFQTQIYPGNKDEQVESLPLPGLLSAIDAYLEAIIELVACNRGKTALKIALAQPGDA